MTNNTLVVNLYGGPGIGKSTACAGIVYHLKKRGINCEQALEYIKEKIWEGHESIVEFQYFIFANQLYRISRLLGKVDVVVTDSPALLSLIYGEVPSAEFKSFVLSEVRKLNSLNIVMPRSAWPYSQIGRLQNYTEAIKLDNIIVNFLDQHNINYIVPGNDIDVVNFVGKLVQHSLNM